MTDTLIPYGKPKLISEFPPLTAAKVIENEVVAMVVHKDVLYVATRTGVYAKDGNGTFHKLNVGE